MDLAVFRHEPGSASAWWSRRYDGFNSPMTLLSSVKHQPTRLLVVDDEPEMRGLLAEYFTRQGFAVQLAADAAQARAQVIETRPDLALLDVTMPGENGLGLLRWLRQEHPRVAVVMLTGNGETVDRVVGLELGADDYVAKPCELRELLARVRAVLRRSSFGQNLQDEQPTQPAGQASTAQVPSRIRAMQGTVAMGDRTLDLDQQRLFGPDGSEIDVSAGEFDLLALFARNPNRPLKRESILAQAHDRGWDVFDRSIDLRIMRLRRKLERNPDKPEVIKTVRGVGYVFVAGPQE